MQIELLQERLRRAKAEEENARLKSILINQQHQRALTEIAELEAHLQSAGPLAEQNPKTPMREQER